MATIRRKGNPFLVLSLVLLGVIAGYMFSSFMSPAPEAAVDETLVVGEQKQSDTIQFTQFETMQFDFSILESASYKSFRVLGQSPIEPGPAGRADIFAPF